MAKLIIDAGHDPKYPGATGEVEWVRQIVAELRNYVDFTLVPDGLGSTDGGGNGNLIRKINWINNNSDGNDTLISIHENAGGGTGNEVWYYGGNATSQTEAARFCEYMAQETGLRNRGAKSDLTNRWGRLAMVRDTEPWAWLLEAGFADAPGNQDEAKGPKVFARGIARFAKSRGFAVRNLDAPAPTPTPTPAPQPTPQPKPPATGLIPPSEYYKLFSPEGKQIGAYKNNLAERIEQFEKANITLTEANKNQAQEIARLNDIIKNTPPTTGGKLTPEELNRLGELINKLTS